MTHDVMTMTLLLIYVTLPCLYIYLISASYDAPYLYHKQKPVLHQMLHNCRCDYVITPRLTNLTVNVKGTQLANDKVSIFQQSVVIFV